MDFVRKTTQYTSQPSGFLGVINSPPVPTDCYHCATGLPSPIDLMINKVLQGRKIYLMLDFNPQLPQQQTIVLPTGTVESNQAQSLQSFKYLGTFLTLECRIEATAISILSKD